MALQREGRTLGGSQNPKLCYPWFHSVGFRWHRHQLIHNLRRGLLLSFQLPSGSLHQVFGEKLSSEAWNMLLPSLTSLTSFPNTHSSNIRSKTERAGTELTIHRNLNGPSEAEEEEDEGSVDPGWCLLPGHRQHQALLPAAQPVGS